MNDVQKACFEILKDFDSVCNEIGIQYHLYSGTLLGSVREKGFIPWDDDIDIVVSRESYTLLKNHLINSKINFRLEYINRSKYKNYTYLFDKIVDRSIRVNQQYFSLDNSLSGPWIDIFVYDTVTDNVKLRKKVFKQIRIVDFLIRINRIDYDPTNDKGLKKIKSLIAYVNHFTISNTLIRSLLLDLKEKISKKMIDPKGSLVADLTFPFSSFEKFEKFVIPKAQLVNPEIVEFENAYFYGFKDNDMVLTKNFGNYMIRPNEKDRTNHDIKIEYLITNE